MVIRGRRQARSATFDSTASIGSALELSTMHLLVVPSTVHPEDVSDLLRARVPGSDLGGQGFVPLGRHSRLTGPYHLSMEEAVDAQVPMPWTVAYALSAPIEREDPPFPGLDDRDGLARAFPHGMPWREEGRALHLMVAMARRVHGAVRVSGGGLLQPDPGRAVDIIVHSPYWLDPDVLLGVVQRILPAAQVEASINDWSGPSDAAYSGELVSPYLGSAAPSAAELAAVHRRADVLDMEALQGPAELDGYAIAADVGAYGTDGAVEVLVHVGRDREPAVAGQPWGSNPFVTYEVRWTYSDWEERERSTPSAHYLAARARMQPLVQSVARVVVEAADGIVTDEDGFWIDRYHL